MNRSAPQEITQGCHSESDSGIAFSTQDAYRSLAEVVCSVGQYYAQQAASSMKSAMSLLTVLAPVADRLLFLPEVNPAA